MKKISREKLNSDQVKTHCQLKPVDIICKDCGVKFQWYAGTLRCSTCLTILKNSRYENKDVYDKTPLTIINSKGNAIGEVKSNKELIAWFDQHTVINSESVGNNRYSGIKAELREKPIMKSICYWFMLSDKYSKELAEELINTKKVRVLKNPYDKLSEKEIETILAIYNEKGLQKDVALKYGVSRPKVNQIKIGRLYSYVTGHDYKRIYNTWKN